MATTQDFMEESDDTCPLCVEELDLSDQHFKPCPCGYQICQFCFNNIKNNMNGLCPACRRPYDDKNIEWKIISPEEFKADVANQARRKAAARQKEAERKQVETLNRKHLQGLRVVQRNLVYITGMSSEGVPEDVLEDQLKAPSVFGQYGRIIKLSANKLKDNGASSALAIFITFADDESAGRCIAALDGKRHQDRILKAQFGTTKYCSAYLRNETCNNRNCTFLHETGDDKDSFSRQELSSLNAASSQARPAGGASPAPRPPPPQHSSSNFVASSTQSSTLHRPETMSRSDSGEGPALPSTANWAKHPQLQQSRRSSQAASRATPSPKTAHAKTVLTRPASRTSSKQVASSTVSNKEREVKESQLGRTSASSKKKMPPAASLDQPPPETWTRLKRAIEELAKCAWEWELNRAALDEETLKTLDTHPGFIDPNGGVHRQALRERHYQMKLRSEETRGVLPQAVGADDGENHLAGSLQLGGEPDVGEDALESGNRNGTESIFQRQAFDNGSSNTQGFGQSSLNDDFSSIDNLGRGIGGQRGGVSLLKNNQDNDAILQQFQRAPNTSQHHSTLSNPFQGQNPVFGGNSRHGRQSSRFTFANDAASATASVKSSANPLLQSKQYSGQSSAQTGFYSGIQGPPPGLKSTSTPPSSGGAMFAQGHGFGNAMAGGFNFGGSQLGGKNTDADGLNRGRAGTGGGLGPDSGKRKFDILPLYSHRSVPLASAETVYGLQSASYSAPSEHTRRNKKGKKHRQANPSSSGGSGTVDVADPSILRMHYNGGSQGQYGATQSQGGYNSQPMAFNGGFGRW